MGALATGGVRLFNEDVVHGLRIPPEVIDAVTARERAELERRERSYRGGRRPPDVEGKTVILIDDGLATGASMRVRAWFARVIRPAASSVSTPVGIVSRIVSISRRRCSSSTLAPASWRLEASMACREVSSSAAMRLNDATSSPNSSVAEMSTR